MVVSAGSDVKVASATHHQPPRRDARTQELTARRFGVIRGALCAVIRIKWELHTTKHERAHPNLFFFATEQQARTCWHHPRRRNNKNTRSPSHSSRADAPIAACTSHVTLCAERQGRGARRRDAIVARPRTARREHTRAARTRHAAPHAAQIGRRQNRDFCGRTQHQKQPATHTPHRIEPHHAGKDGRSLSVRATKIHRAARNERCGTVTNEEHHQRTSTSRCVGAPLSCACEPVARFVRRLRL